MLLFDCDCWAAEDLYILNLARLHDFSLWGAFFKEPGPNVYCWNKSPRKFREHKGFRGIGGGGGGSGVLLPRKYFEISGPLKLLKMHWIFQPYHHHVILHRFKNIFTILWGEPFDLLGEGGGWSACGPRLSPYLRTCKQTQVTQRLKNSAWVFRCFQQETPLQVVSGKHGIIWDCANCIFLEAKADRRWKWPLPSIQYSYQLSLGGLRKIDLLKLKVKLTLRADPLPLP